MGEKPVFFGLYTVKDAISFCVWVVGAAVFLILFNHRLTAMESNIKIFSQYITNSDNYHSRILGVEFSNGRPTGDEPKIQKARKILNGEDPDDTKNGS